MKNRTLVIGIAIVALVFASLSCKGFSLGLGGATTEDEDATIVASHLTLIAPRTEEALTPHPVVPTEGELHAESGTRVPSSTPPAASVVEEFLRVWSTGIAYNTASAPTTFTIDQAWQVTEIVTYHWNDGQGASPGTIGLRAADGTLYGPWQAAAMEGSGVSDAAWVVNPNVVIPPGSYTVIDSDPNTWSQNQETGGAGMTWGKGFRQGSP